MLSEEDLESFDDELDSDTEESKVNRNDKQY